MYRTLWNDVVRSEAELLQPETFERLPLVRKEDYRDAGPERFLSHGYAPAELAVTRSSGTTGVGLEMFFSEPELDHVAARQYRGMTMAGCRPWHKTAYTRMSPVPFALKQRDDGSQGVMGLFETHHLPYPSAPEETLARLERVRPRFYSCYPSYARELAGQLEHDRLQRLELSAIVLNSEQSTPDERAYLGRAFGCAVHDIYGAEEFWCLASLCSHGRYHLSSDALWVEVLDDDGRRVAPGERGRVVISSLIGRAMPFVRYELGDYARLGTQRCGCGRRTQVLESIDGRILDELELSSGRKVQGHDARIFLEIDERWRALVFEQLGGVQIVQTHLDRVEVRYADARDPCPTQMELFERRFAEFLDHEASVVWRRVPALLRTANGKVPMVRSLLTASSTNTAPPRRAEA